MKNADEIPESAALPSRPVSLCGLRLSWPLASPEEIVVKGGAFTGGALIKVTWKLVVVSFLMSIWNVIDADLFKPFLFSRVHCCQPGMAPLDDSYNLTSAAQIDAYVGQGAFESGLRNVGACEVPAMARDNVYWSGSVHCANKAFVQQEAQSLNAIYSAIKTYTTLLVLPLGGHWADCWGRKRVLFLTGFFSVVFTMCYFADSLSSNSPSHGDFWLFIAPVFHGAQGSSFAAGAAMVVDMIHPLKLGKVLPLKAMADTLGPMVGNVVGISIVSVHLDDFAAFWLVFSVAGIGVVTFMWWGEPRNSALVNVKTAALSSSLASGVKSLASEWLLRKCSRRWVCRAGGDAAAGDAPALPAAQVAARVLPLLEPAAHGLRAGQAHLRRLWDLGLHRRVRLFAV